MSKIKVGDSVVCVNAAGVKGLLKGKIYNVDDVKRIGASDSITLQEFGKNRRYFSASRFKPIKRVEEELQIDQVKQPNAQGGIKFDQGKKDYTLLFQDLKVTVDEVTDVLELGAKKYARGNYKLIESDRYHKALLRHLMSYLSGEITDPETGKHHLAHAICCAAFLIEREVIKGENHDCV